MPSTFKVYFAAFGEWEEPAIVSSIIGREPDVFLAKGDPIVGRSSLARKGSIWQISSGLEPSEPIEEQLEALLNKLERFAAGVRRASEQHAVGINCAAYWRTSQPGFHLSEELLARVTALGLSLDFDMYCLGDEGESGG